MSTLPMLPGRGPSDRVIHLCFLLLTCALFPVLTSLAQPSLSFDTYFVDRTLRVDYYHIGDNDTELITFDQMKEEGPWAGNPGHLIDNLGFGHYRIALIDIASNLRVYQRGYDALFDEYRTTEPAKKGIKKTYHESVLMPYPRHPVLFVIESRDRNNLYRALITKRIDPDDYHIIRESVQRGDETIDVLVSGDPHTHVDLLVLAEGYTASDREKFKKDLDRYAASLFSWEPYKSLKKCFNIRGVFHPSPESGVDEPRQGKFRATTFDASFNALDTDRYMLTESNKTIHDIAAAEPCDALLIMVNSKRYGGGGIYNWYTIFTSDGPWNDYVFVHEFGHAFAGLADEYYTREVSYDEYFPQGVEPVEPNITALLNPSELKWKDLVTPGLPIPTPWGQERFDSLGTARDSLAALRDKATGSRKDSLDAALKVLNEQVSTFLINHPLKGKVGAFEGAGYVPKGFYRPTVNSMMNQFHESDRSFYPVSARAIETVVKFFCGD